MAPYVSSMANSLSWGISIPDRLAFALADIGRPATVDEMVLHIGENRSRNSVNNALAYDVTAREESAVQNGAWHLGVFPSMWE